MARQPAATEQRLLRHATALISSRGLAESTFQELADRAGVSRPTVYNYFSTKDELLWRIIGDLAHTLIDRIRPIAQADAAPLERLSRMVEAQMRVIFADSRSYRIYYAERPRLSAENRTNVAAVEAELHDLFADVIGQAQRRGDAVETDADLLARLASSTVSSTLLWFRSTSADDRESIINLTSNFVVRGLQSGRAELRSSAS